MPSPQTLRHQIEASIKQLYAYSILTRTLQKRYMLAALMAASKNMEVENITPSKIRKLIDRRRTNTQ